MTSLPPNTPAQACPTIRADHDFRPGLPEPTGPHGVALARKGARPALLGSARRHPMNWDQIEGKWKQFAGSARQRWGEITDDEYQQVAGKRDQMVGLVQEKYGQTRADAEREVDEWFGKL